MPPTRSMSYVAEDAPQQTYFGYRIVIDEAVPAMQAWVVYPNHPASFEGRSTGLTEMHMRAETNELVQQNPNRKDVKMVLAPAAAAAA